VIENFGDLNEEFQQERKYAKWKAAYIHNCLKAGETPIPGPAAAQGSEDLEGLGNWGQASQSSPGFSHPQPPNQPHVPSTTADIQAGFSA